MIPKFRFFASDEFIGMYNVIDIRFDESIIVIEDRKNTSMIEVVEEDYSISTNGYPTFCYHFEEGHLMQFSGCQDINGKDVYEGDIIMWYFDTIDNQSELPDVLNNLLGIDEREEKIIYIEDSAE